MSECKHIYGYEKESTTNRGDWKPILIDTIDDNMRKEYDEEEWWQGDENVEWFKYCPRCGKPMWHGRLGGNNGKR